MDPAILIDRLTHRYGQRVALEGVSLAVPAGAIVGLLGPNGSGKTTLFRVLSTLLPPQEGSVRVLGLDLARQRQQVRPLLGVIFQSPSTDGELTARENVVHHGHLYGLRGRELKHRAAEMLDRVGLTGRIDEPVKKLSGGMRRRVELAKGLLNRPPLLLMDEPSTGLDPAARIDLWRYLAQVQGSEGVTILLTTHLMEEAERCGRLAILDGGRLVAEGAPAVLRQSVGGEVIHLAGPQPQALREALMRQLGVPAQRVQVIGPAVRLEWPEDHRPPGHELVGRLMSDFNGLVESVSVGRPTLEDVFIHVTGHRFSEQ